MSSSKKMYLQRDFAAGVYLSEAQNPIPYPPYTLYLYVYTLQYTYSNRRRVETKRRIERQQFTKLGRNTNMTDCISSL
jgi:hypothetical protein